MRQDFHPLLLGSSRSLFNVLDLFTIRFGPAWAFVAGACDACDACGTCTTFRPQESAETIRENFQKQKKHWNWTCITFRIGSRNRVDRVPSLLSSHYFFPMMQNCDQPINKIGFLRLPNIFQRNNANWISTKNKLRMINHQNESEVGTALHLELGETSWKLG